MFDFPVLAERGADDADGRSAVGLNFKMTGMRLHK